MENGNKRLKIMVELAIVGIMGLALYYLFKDSYKEILAQIGKTEVKTFVVILVLGNLYFFIDGFVYWNLLRKEGYQIHYFRCVAIAYMSVFFNVVSFGAGIKPAQVLYLNQKGIEPGKAISIVTMPYIFQKTVIVLYALIMLLFNHTFVVDHFQKTFVYIYMGAGLSILIICFIILLCASEKFHKIVLRIIGFFFKGEKHIKSREFIEMQIGGLREGSLKIVKNPKAWFFFTGTFVLKMSCWYVIPAIALFASGGDLAGITIGQALTMTALMQLIMGVIPTAGGVGSLEVVFSLLFAAVFGEVMAGACMILYRLATYYVPFVISALMMFFISKDLKKEPFEIRIEHI